MPRSYIEKRVIKAGVELSQQRISQKGTKIEPDDIKKLRIKTFSPALQGVYVVLGALLFVFGMWVQYMVGNMAVSMGLVLIGFLNAAYGIHGRPKQATDISGLDIVDLSAEIVREIASGERKSGDN
ncbi:MAG: hypothetical protein MKZ70_13240 [Opitutales bacterium]|nr:hypothetical protein [Opitutales bacterium]MCH2615629.1 hypothetical protein [Opitutales bacterium]|tara:strand:+ start:2779 stop:3156 length:378 start_codon:yes stop_codon:yes gene_type:complete